MEEPLPCAARRRVMSYWEGGCQANYWELRAITRELAVTREGYWSILRNLAIFLKLLWESAVVKLTVTSVNIVCSWHADDFPSLLYSKKRISKTSFLVINLSVFVRTFSICVFDIICFTVETFGPVTQRSFLQQMGIDMRMKVGTVVV